MELVLTRQTIAVLLLCALCFHDLSGQFVRPGSSANNPQNTFSSSSSNCNYILSAGAGGTCVVTTKDVERRFNLITDEMARTRLQFIAQNSILQSQLANLTTTDRNLLLQINGLQRNLQALQSRVQLPVSSGPSTGTNSNLNQLQATLTQQINALDKRLTNLSGAHQRDAVAAAKTDSALQQQLTQVLRVNQQLQSTVLNLTQDLASFKRTYATDLKQITTNISDINVELKALDRRVTAVKQQSDNVYNSLRLFNTNVLPALRNDITTVQADLTSVQTTVKSLQNGQVALLNSTVFIRSDLSSLQTDLTQGQTKQDQAIIQYAQGVTSSLGNNVQIRRQLQGIQQKLQTQLSPNAVVAPPLLPSGKTTPGIVAPPTLFPRPG